MTKVIPVAKVDHKELSYMKEYSEQLLFLQV